MNCSLKTQPSINKCGELKSIKVMCLNIQGMSQKESQLEVLLDSEKNIDILCVCEHWHDESSMKYSNINGYKLISFYCRGPEGYGGTAIYAKKGTY